MELNEAQPIESRFELTNLTSDQIVIYVQQRSINPEIEAAFRKIVQQKNQLDALDREVSRRDDQEQKDF